ncbi:MAG: hypothetical protein AAB458_03205 [Patescibacteria group bacterium]
MNFFLKILQSHFLFALASLGLALLVTILVYWVCRVMLPDFLGRGMGCLCGALSFTAAFVVQNVGYASTPNQFSFWFWILAVVSWLILITGGLAYWKISGG